MMLCWFLDPREGHHQHDYFIKQLLGAYVQNLPDDFPLNHAFELLNHSYSEAQVITEFTLPNNKRIDIAVVDRSSKTLILIERKDGTKAHSNQLSAYRDWAQSHFSNWTQIYILSDSHEQEHGAEFDSYYLQMNDGWLILAIKQILSLPYISNEVQVNLQNTLRLIDEDFEYPIEKQWSEINKKLSQKYSPLIKELKSATLTLCEQNYSLLDIEPRTYLKLISKSPELLADPLLNALQDNYYELYHLSTFNEFEYFEDNISTIVPAHIVLSLEYGREKINFTHKLHTITQDDVWPYFLTLSCSNSEEQSFDLSIHLNKNANENALKYANAMENAYGFQPSRKKIYFEHLLLTNIDDVSLNKGTILRQEIDRFFDWIKKID